MEPKSCGSNMGLLGTAFWLAIIFVVFIIVPVLIANWIAARVYPLPDGPMNESVTEDLFEKRDSLATWLAAGFLVIIIIAALLAD